jgi:hypothetical protein
MVATIAGPNWAIPFGVPVHTADGERLGFLADATAYDLIIENGFLVRHTFVVPMADIDRVEHGVLVLGVSRDQVSQCAASADEC